MRICGLASTLRLNAPNILGGAALLGVRGILLRPAIASDAVKTNK